MAVLTDEEVGLKSVLSDEDVGLEQAKTLPQFLAEKPYEFEIQTISGIPNKELPTEGMEKGPIRTLWEGATEPAIEVGKYLGVSPQTLADAIDAIGAYQAQSEGILTPEEAQEVLAAPSRKPTIPEKAIAGAQQAVVNTLDFFTSPLGAATLGTSALPQGAQKAIAGAFTVSMAMEAPKQIQELSEAVKSKEPERIGRAATGLGLNAAFIAAGARTVFKPTEIVVEQARQAGAPATAVALEQVLPAKEPIPVEQAPPPKEAPEAAGEVKMAAAEQPATAPQLKISPESEVKPLEEIQKEEKVQEIKEPQILIARPIAAPETKAVGMGAAVPGEFELTPRTPTGIKNATVEVERQQRGLPPAIEPVRRSFGQVWDQAMAKIDQDPGYPDRLIGELKDKPRAVTDLEDATLLHRQVDLQNEYGKATRDLAQAYDDGRMDDVGDINARVAALSDSLFELYEINKKVGTETGRGLSARRMMANEDFTLASLELQKRAAKGGEKLTDTERAELEKVAKDYRTKNEALEKYLAEKVKELSDAGVKRALGEIEKEPMPEGGEPIVAGAALKGYKTRTRNRIAELEKRIEAGEFGTKPKRELVLDKQALELKHELEAVKRDFREGLLRDRLARRTLPQKLFSGITETINAFRAIMTSFDLSAVLRQGGFITFAHPIRAAKALPSMFKALRSEANRFEVDQEILHRENYKLYQESGLYLSEHGHKLSQMEEAYMSHWAQKIPGVAASERAYTTFLNRLRADSFEAMAKTLSRDGKPTLKEAQAISNFINVATGRGTSLGMSEAAMTGLNTVFFAPRYVASRFQLLAGQPLFKGTAKTRALVASEYARFLVGAGVVYALAQSMGGEVESDPRSSDFGKIRFGNTRIDPMAGLLQGTVLISRLGTGETITAKGRLLPIRGPGVKRGGTTSWDVLSRFVRTKLSPAFGTGVDLVTGKNVVGEEVTPASAAGGLVTPLSMRDIYDAMKEQGIPEGTIMALLSIFGMGLQTYNEHERRK